ncbi:MAG: alpha/beta hydrolase fold domain-containing protein [Candidatus Latescibacteria bacterium]|nr:alpha/beta hydrolase fold domain-containing protein [Candidatus Latescibacterota bacterium]
MHSAQIDIPYGPDPRQVIDFHPTPGQGPHPLLIYIHGGGWRGGDKTQDTDAFRPYLEQGISYAAVNYRLTDTAILPAPVYDAARAVQFIRSNAEAWNIDPQRLALTGGSAGACTSMWLLYHTDLADPQAADPIARQSTRVSAAAVAGGQTSIDPRIIEPWLGPQVLEHQMIYRSVGAESVAQALEKYPSYEALYREFSPINHIEADAPPLLMTYDHNMTLPSQNPGHGIHHPVYGVKLQQRARELGVECHLLIEGVSQSDRYTSPQQFLFDKLLDS